MLFEILTVVALTLLNGLLAMSELAIVSARTARLQVMADKGSTGAATAIRLAAHPGRFLSSVQIGITLVGVLSGAFSGATLGDRLANYLLSQGVAENIAHTAGVGGVVVAITYLSLIVGELVPKQIALRNPEGIAAMVAPLMRAVSIGAAPLVWLLDKSGKVILFVLRQSGDSGSGMSDEEVRMVLTEARNAGVIEDAETQMIAGVMRIADRTARGMMTPRHEVLMIRLGDHLDQVIAQFRASGKSRLPVYEGDTDNVLGALSGNDLLGLPADADLRPLIANLPVIREGLPALDVIEILRKTPQHMVLVYDEYGHFEGIVTTMNLVENIAGDFDTSTAAEEKFTTRKDGSLLVSGWMAADELAELLGMSLPRSRDYDTVAGLVIDRMGSLPQVGETVVIEGWTFEVMDLDGRRIDKLLVNRNGAGNGGGDAQ